jgi:hypothetical protein
MEKILNTYKIVHYQELDNLSENLGVSIKFINAKNDYEAMAIVRDNYNIPLGWIKSSTLAKSGGK